MRTACSLAIVVVFVSFGVSFSQQTELNRAPGPAENTRNRPGMKTQPDKAIERTRRQVKMLDDVYKGGIVLITKHYVNGSEDLPAGTAFKKLFEAAKEKGWHEVRLVDATGDPFNDENVPISDFEKKAIKALKAGKSFVDETVTENEVRYLLAATPIPVVMEKCTMCHSNYDFEDKGQVVGALTYRIPVDE